MNQNNNVFLRDYAHAANAFRRESFSNAPRLKFLFHVYFTINIAEIPALASIYGNNNASTISLLVKNIQLPSFEIDTETVNQYNRKRIVQKKINYRPVSLEFHDDGSDRIRQLWYNYFSYYYKDPTQSYDNVPSLPTQSAQQTGFGYNTRDIYTGDRVVNNWGLAGESYGDTVHKPQFFRDIKIYGFDQDRFAEYILINPIIKSWEHDSYDYSEDAGTMSHKVSIEYETVKYYSGNINQNNSGNNVSGFADPAYYDNAPGALIYPSTTR